MLPRLPSCYTMSYFGNAPVPLREANRNTTPMAASILLGTDLRWLRCAALVLAMNPRSRVAVTYVAGYQRRISW